MNIQDYIKEIVFQIADGVNEVIKEQKKHNVIINPEMTIGSSVDVRFIPKNTASYKNYGRPTQLLRLEMGIETTEENRLEVKGGIGFSVFKVGGGGTEGAMQSNTNRVSIAIPICLPTSSINEE